MSVLDLDFYKLTMLQFIWKYYADVPVTFRLHSRKQDLSDIISSPGCLASLAAGYYNEGISDVEVDYLLELGVFERAFVDDLNRLFGDKQLADVEVWRGGVEVSGSWFNVSLWETVILSMVSEQYSTKHIAPPSLFKQANDIMSIGQSGAWWADFGTRRRYSQATHEELIARLRQEDNRETGFIGTSNVDLARRYDLTPIGTYAHELEMVLRPYFDSEFDTTRDVLTKWQEIYPHRFRIALTDTYTTSKFLADHGNFLLENDWRGVRLDSGYPFEVGFEVVNFIGPVDAKWDLVFSDGLDADMILRLQHIFSSEPNVHPVFGWGTGLTNPNSDLSLVMKAVESDGQPTYKITDDDTKSIGN